MPNSARPCKSNQRGITLIETMIAILILAFGMLGLAGMQAATTKFRLGSEIRTALTELNGDIGDRMRVNLSKLPGYVVGNEANYIITKDYPTQVATTGTFSLTKDCAAITCDGDQLAKYDLELWQKSVKDKLPAGASYISGDIKDGFVVTMMWFDKGFLKADGSTLDKTETCDVPLTYTQMRSQRCCPVAVKAPDGVRCTNFTVMP
jgi:type IV pilus assembly protein PilV